MNWSGTTKSVGLCSSLSDPDGGDRDDALHAELLHRVNIGAKVQLRGQQPMAAPMPRQKGHLAAFQLAQNEAVRRVANGRRDLLFANIRQAGH
jgi:hypothetical protein